MGRLDIPALAISAATAHAHDRIPLPVEATSPALGEVDRSDKPGFVQAQEGPIGRNQTPIAELRMLRTMDTCDRSPARRSYEPS